MPSPTERYTAALARLRNRARQGLTAMWDRLPGLDVADSLDWHRSASPLVTAVAQASSDLSTAYVGTVATASPISPLIVSTAPSHLWEPFDRLRVSQRSLSWPAAMASARQVVEMVASDSVYRTARYTTAFALPDVGEGWIRAVTGDSCKWCLSLSDVVFPSAARASFGHGNCDCVPVPAGAGMAANQAVYDAVGWDAEAKAEYQHRDQLRSIEKQERIAVSRQAGAERELLTEADPARRERLSIRAQEWETRAELAAERQRILRTGTHHL